ncbi:MAG TPA: serine/threonine-protein kinase [Polyangiales bacterium]
MWLGTPSIGSVVGGKYRLTRSLGGGGMSLVFAAENTVTSKQVALKFLFGSVADRPDAKARLLREARAGSRIKHRNVVDVYDVGFEGETMFLVMDLLEGETLAHVLENTTMSIRALLGLLIPAMRGVAEAHRQGVVHRDIKPDNILLAREVDQTEPVVTVLDFGVAMVEGDSLRTRSGNASGTPMFMSAEQIRGQRDLDGRVDVYGFGVILYMALSGRLPVVAETLAELIYKLTSTPVLPLTALRPELPRELCEVVARAMEREREDRTPTLERLIFELTPFVTGSAELGETRQVRYGGDVEPMPTTISARVTDAQGASHTPLGSQCPPRDPVTRRSRRRWPMALIALAALVMLAVSMLRARATPALRQAQAAAIVPAPVAPTITSATPPTARAERVAAPVFLGDAGIQPVRTTSAKSARARRAGPVRSEPPSVTPSPTRRRLVSEDFFVTP